VVDGLLRAWELEIQPHAGPLPRQLTSRHESHARYDGRIVNPVVASQLAADQFPASAGAFRALLSLPALWEMVRPVLPSPALVQIAWVESHEGTAWHQDYHPRIAGAPIWGLWIALEDVVTEAGPFRWIPGTHADDFASAWREQAWYASRAQRVDQTDPRGEAGAWLAATVDAELAASGREVAHLLPHAGDVFAWNGALIHGSLPPTPGTRRTRRSVLIHLIARDGA
jgi:hypothetical protein